MAKQNKGVVGKPVEKDVKDKMWSELKVEEKIERSRDVIRALHNHLMDVQDSHNELSNMFRGHRHDKDEKITVTLESAIIPVKKSNKSKAENDEVFF